MERLSLVENNSTYPTNIDPLTDKLEWEFQPFFNEMINELIRHYPENGDSWKTCDRVHLERLLLKSMSCMTHEYIEYNPSHLLDIANFCAFCYLRYYDSSPTTKMEKE